MGSQDFEKYLVGLTVSELRVLVGKNASNVDALMTIRDHILKHRTRKKAIKLAAEVSDHIKKYHTSEFIGSETVEAVEPQIAETERVLLKLAEQKDLEVIELEREIRDDYTPLFVCVGDIITLKRYSDGEERRIHLQHDCPTSSCGGNLILAWIESALGQACVGVDLGDYVEIPAIEGGTAMWIVTEIRRKSSGNQYIFSSDKKSWGELMRDGLGIS